MRLQTCTQSRSGLCLRNRAYCRRECWCKSVFPFKSTHHATLVLSTTVVIVAAVAIFNVVFNIAGVDINLIEAIVVIAVLVIIISSCPQFQTEP